MGLKGVIWHWDAGDHESDRLADGHYHYHYDDDGTEHAGRHTVADNFNVRDGDYAAHTLNSNTGYAGLSALGMHGSNFERRDKGRYPITQAACEAMCKRTADLLRRNGLPVTRRTALSHAEVQRNLGIRQRGKWDIQYLPYKGFGHNGFASSRECGDFLRDRVRAMLGGDRAPLAGDQRRTDVRTERNSYLQRLLVRSGFDIGPAGDDGILGGDTRKAIEEFQREVELPTTGRFDAPTVEALRAAHEERGAREAAEIASVGGDDDEPKVEEATPDAPAPFAPRTIEDRLEELEVLVEQLVHRTTALARGR